MHTNYVHRDEKHEAYFSHMMLLYYFPIFICEWPWQGHMFCSIL